MAVCAHLSQTESLCDWNRCHKSFIVGIKAVPISERVLFGWFQALMPKEERFFVLFNRHAALLIGGAEALKAVLAGGDALAQNCARVVQYENQADQVTLEVIQAVRRTFITPFERGDITDLITLMDDAVDQMRQTVKAIGLFELREFDPLMRELGDIILQSAQKTAEVIGLLGTMKKEAERLHSLTQEIRQLEEHSDELHDQGLKTILQTNGRSDPMAFIIGSAMYEHLEKVVDRFENVANRVSDILIEHL
jgi:uncharacterized protein